MARPSIIATLLCAAALAAPLAASRQAGAQALSGSPYPDTSAPAPPRPLPPIVRPNEYHGSASRQVAESLWYGDARQGAPTGPAVEYVISDGGAKTTPATSPARPAMGNPAYPPSQLAGPPQGPPAQSPQGPRPQQAPPSDYRVGARTSPPPQYSQQARFTPGPEAAPGRPVNAVQTAMPRAADGHWLHESAAPPPHDDVRLPSVAPSAPRPNIFEPAQVIARVGDQPILAGDVLGTVNQVLDPYKDRASEEELNERRRILMKQYLDNLVTTKLVYLDFLRMVPKEALPTIERKVNESFEANQLPKLLKKAKVETAVELDAELRKHGESIAKQRRAYMEQALASQMMTKNVNMKPEVTREQMLKHYREHESDYYVPAQARWEHLMARFDKFPSQAAAHEAIAAMGNEVLGGAPLPAVARRSSQGPTADEGGQSDWTSKGSLRSKQLDEAIFTLPVGRLSQIIADDRGLHIVRVIERRDEGRVPFEEAQVAIKETLQKEIVRAEMAAYLEKLRAQTTVWTIFDEPAPAEQTPPAHSGAVDRSRSSAWGG